MKKIFALALAALMTAGMTTVAFAVDNSVGFVDSSNLNAVVVDVNDDGKFDNTAVKDNVYTTTGGHFNGFAREDGGKKVAIPVYDAYGNALTDEDALRGWRVKAEWSVGDLDEKPDFEFVKIGTAYQWAVTFTLPDSAELKTDDLGGSITIYKASADLRNPYDGVNKVYFGVEYGYGTLNYDDPSLVWEDAEIVTFKNADGEEIMDFGTYFTFETDVTGQGKLNLKNNQDFNKEFAAMYDYANIDFVNFEYEPTFNKIGTAYIYADEDAYIYEVTADGAKEIKGLKWDEDYEAWTFKTRTLKSYAISDVELTEKTATEDKDDASSTTDGGKENPDTGR